MFLPGAPAALLAAAGIFATPLSAGGGPKIRLHVEGQCPGVEALTRAFGDSRVAVAAAGARESAWSFTVTRDEAAHQARLSLRGEDGALAFERDVEGDDCAGIAGVAAVVVEAYFMEIHLLDEPRTEAPAAEPSPPEAAAVPERRERAGPPPATFWLTLGLAGGGVFYADPSLTAWSGEASLGVRYEKLATAVVASLASPTTQESAGDRVRRTEFAVRLDVAYHLQGRPLWVEPGVALYALGSTVTALDLAGEPSASRTDFGAGPFVVAGVPLTPAISLMATAAAALLFRRDQYVVEPSGVVAESPGARFFLGLGARSSLPL